MHRTYAKMHEQYGPVVREKVHKDRTLLHVFDPRDMQIVYSNEGPKPTRISHRALAKYRQERPHLYSGPGLFPS
ncbi:Cytochrome P450 302a1, mitochondrial, partial [Stegodyphus mimosarum]